MSMWYCGPTLVSYLTWYLIQFQLLEVIQARPESLQHHQERHYEQLHVNGTTKFQKLPDTLIADVDYFDKLNVESQLNNPRFVELQIKCLIYNGPCDIFGKKARGK